MSDGPYAVTASKIASRMKARGLGESHVKLLPILVAASNFLSPPEKYPPLFRMPRSSGDSTGYERNMS
jgi:hypothetical protein